MAASNRTNTEAHPHPALHRDAVMHVAAMKMNWSCLHVFILEHDGDDFADLRDFVESCVVCGLGRPVPCNA